MKKNHGPWSLLPEGLLVLVLIFFESVLPGPYMGGPYKMIMRVSCKMKCVSNAANFIISENRNLALLTKVLQ